MQSPEPGDSKSQKSDRPSSRSSTPGISVVDSQARSSSDGPRSGPPHSNSTDVRLSRVFGNADEIRWHGRCSRRNVRYVWKKSESSFREWRGGQPVDGTLFQVNIDTEQKRRTYVWCSYDKRSHLVLVSSSIFLFKYFESKFCGSLDVDSWIFLIFSSFKVPMPSLLTEHCKCSGPNVLCFHSRSVKFISDVIIVVDYTGKQRVDLEKGTLRGILSGFAQLNGSQLKLKRFHKYGLVDHVFNFRIQYFCLHYFIISH